MRLTRYLAYEKGRALTLVRAQVRGWKREGYVRIPRVYVHGRLDFDCDGRTYFTPGRKGPFF